MIKILPQNKFGYILEPLTKFNIKTKKKEEINGVIEVTSEELEALNRGTHCFDESLTRVIPYIPTEAEILERKARDEQVMIEMQIADLKTQLAPIKEKLEQDQWGEVVPNIEQYRAEAIRLHTQMRKLEGKEPRKLKIDS